MDARSSVDQTPSDDAPLSEEQLAVYRARIESGFYHSPAVLKHIADRITDEIRPPEID